MLKSDRLLQIEYLLLQHPDGMTRSELSRRLGVHKSTIGRDITTMSSSCPIHEDDSGRLFMDKHGYLTSVSLTMFELEALHLSSRLFSRVMKFPFPHAAGALRKLAEAQGMVSTSLAERIKETAEEIELSTSAFTDDYIRYRRVIEELGIAISERRPVTIDHFSQKKGKTQQFTLLPVTLEPHHEGKAVHLVAWEHTADPPAFRTLKIERIVSLTMNEPSPELFTSVPVERLRKRLKDAWSIWTSDKAPQRVVLRFSPDVAARVRETLWHESQEMKDGKDGSVTWSGRIAEPKEMYPWIRGWGPDVEVLEPSWLRDMHREDFRKGLELYEKER